MPYEYVTPEEAAVICGRTSRHVRGFLGARLGEIIVGVTKGGFLRRIYRKDLCEQFAAEAAAKRAKVEADRALRDRTLPAPKMLRGNV